MLPRYFMGHLIFYPFFFSLCPEPSRCIEKLHCNWPELQTHKLQLSTQQHIHKLM